MSPTLILAAVLFAVAILGVLGLRHFSNRVRIAFDLLCFVAITLFLFREGASPMFAPLPPSPTTGDLWLRAIGAAWWLLGARIAAAAIVRSTTHRDQGSRGARLFSDLASAVIYIGAAAAVLNSVLALPVTGLLATSGVLAIVLGLALQNTLSDVFSGIAVGLEAPFSVGDHIQIGDKIEGRVIQVNWRSIWVQTDSDDVAIVPNSLVAKAEIVNRSLPNQGRSQSIELTCQESAAPEQVIELLLHATLLCPNISRNPEPKAVLTLLGRKANSYKITFFVETMRQLSPTKDQLLRAARRQLHCAGLLDKPPLEPLATPTGTRDAIAPRRLLSGLMLFEYVAEAQLAELAERLEPLRLEPGDVLFAQETVDATLFVVASGIVEFVRDAEGVTTTIGCIGAGEYIGEVGLLTGAAHAVTATARTHCLVYRLPHDALAPLLKDNADLAASFDKSARRGLDILNRAVAAHDTPYIAARGQLLTHIRAFFHHGPA